ncbi:hypothetical protein PCG10_004950 [Penicillium crustosum]|uniref:SHSP domain-containing protein n=1 Tax=Penicillium crustosum TaxID=36656 RepID=A0A9P5GS41_PENCR|nr:uncharacterized protein N7487_006951 [Penicillium crustosum]KAF7529975.1 hypothetical protein PCG10_004950 [Penicillium crustosum]KAJ5412592.1 hypothetical protein N7487_006951 [Penicillium crustosum]
MSIRALNQNFPSSDFAANMDEEAPSHPFFPPRGEGPHPNPNRWSLNSGNGQVGRPGYPYPSPWAQVGDEDQAKEANNEAGDGSAFSKSYPYRGPAEGHPSHTYPGPLPWHKPHAYSGPAEGRKPYPSPWDDDKTKLCPRKPYPYPGPADGHKIHTYLGAAPLRQPYPSLWEEDDKDKTSFHQQPHPFPSGPHGGHGNRGWGGHGFFGQPHFGGHSFGGFGRRGFEEPHASHGPWVTSQQVPYKSPTTGSDKYKPEVDVFNTPEAFVIHVPLPGAKKEDIELNWDPKAVAISITGVIRRPGSEDLVKKIALDERKVGAFERKVRLGSPMNPPKVDGDSISAKLEDGVLVIEVPKTEPDDVEVKKVEVE